MEQDIYTEAPSSYDTLANLGPLARLAGRWYGDQGEDTHPQADGPETEPYVETIDFDLLDAQNNGPQVLYGLRYHVAVKKPGENA
ncbi:MAG: heme-binding beta-barrel domain-containing protein, partial [Mailhella sp.]|nr:heme-binding beta-barrel domain-containing protein [Mailhella sp.]